MKIGFDPAKRERILRKLGLDFADAASVFAGLPLTIEDQRFEYGEARFQTYDVLRERVAAVWTARENVRHGISMRHCHEREAPKVRDDLG